MNTQPRSVMGSSLSLRRAVVRLAALGVAVMPIASGCTKAQTQGVSSSYLIVDSLQAASGAKPSEFGGTLASDVLTFVKRTVNGQETRVPTVFSDSGSVKFRLGLKDPGSSQTPTSPTTPNFITVTRYHVEFIRSDGRSQQGVDIPYSFDGAATVTVTDTGGGFGFTLVRIQAKEESPLQALTSNGGAQVISTIAQITFFGTDQAGRAVSVTGLISVNFADWGDPD
jgi:hypothetical protein